VRDSGKDWRVESWESQLQGSAEWNLCARIFVRDGVAKGWNRGLNGKRRCWRYRAVEIPEKGRRLRSTSTRLNLITNQPGAFASVLNSSDFVEKYCSFGVQTLHMFSWEWATVPNQCCNVLILCSENLARDSQTPVKNSTLHSGHYGPNRYQHCSSTQCLFHTPKDQQQTTFNDLEPAPESRAHQTYISNCS
jgi:hypothetical protein